MCVCACARGGKRKRESERDGERKKREREKERERGGITISEVQCGEGGREHQPHAQHAAHPPTAPLTQRNAHQGGGSDGARQAEDHSNIGKKDCSERCDDDEKKSLEDADQCVGPREARCSGLVR